jgi:hypothetical protein
MSAWFEDSKPMAQWPAESDGGSTIQREIPRLYFKTESTSA